MFILTRIADVVQIKPVDFHKKSEFAIEDNINAKYANKVIQRIGLCVCMYDLLKVSDGLIGHGDGLVNVNVEFRMIVFRPSKGEIIYAKLSSCSERGIRLRLDFFDSVFVEPHLLLQPIRFDHNEQVWVWSNEGTDYYFDKNECVRFRVESEQWSDEEKDSGSPYSIIASMAQGGLGVTDWW